MSFHAALALGTRITSLNMYYTTVTTSPLGGHWQGLRANQSARHTRQREIWELPSGLSRLEAVENVTIYFVGYS